MAKSVDPAKVKLDPGDWFLGVACVKCRTPIVMMPTRTKPKDDFKVQGFGDAALTCPNSECRHKTSYQMEQLQRFQVGPFH